jgi:hypothetical protein
MEGKWTKSKERIKPLKLTSREITYGVPNRIPFGFAQDKFTLVLSCLKSGMSPAERDLRLDLAV